MVGDEGLVHQVKGLLEQPKEGLGLSVVAWSALYLVVIFIPGISDKCFDFKVSSIHNPAAAIQHN